MNWYKKSQYLSVTEELGISTPKKYYLFDKENNKLVSKNNAVDEMSEQMMTQEQADHANATYTIGQWMTAEEIREWLK